MRSSCKHFLIISSPSAKGRPAFHSRSKTEGEKRGEKKEKREKKEQKRNKKETKKGQEIMCGKGMTGKYEENVEMIL